MVKSVRKRTHNLYDFMKEHPELKLEVAKDNTLSVTFPENLSSKTLIQSNGKIVFLQYAFENSKNLFTYDALKDPNYYQNLEKLLDELRS